MNIMVMNCGSSSLKYRVISMPEEKELAGGEAQRVGPKTQEPARIIHRAQGKENTHFVDMADHEEAFKEVMKILKKTPELEPDALGHRVVHGGDRFGDHTLVNKKIIGELEEIQDLAPLHNPPAVNLLKACLRLYPQTPMSAIFDTSYHSTMPDYARSYALPEKFRKEYGIRKYGFHGTSHQFVVEETARLMNMELEEFNAVSCHLGSGGASLCAVVGGKSMDNTMGYSPLQGLMMSTRSGDLDPSIVLQLMARSHGDAGLVEKRLNKNSGVLGMSGVSADIRDIFKMETSPEEKSPEVSNTASLYLWRIRKYIGSYLAAVGRPHALIFTDTIGETMPAVRSMVCSGMEAFGLKIDAERNDTQDLPAEISAPDSDVKIFAIRTNEELAIARRSYALIMNARNN